MSIDGDHAPLRRGTRAEIRQFSQSGLANRYVDLSLPPNATTTIPDGGVIDTDKTVTQVDLDELYNTLDAPTRKALQDFFKGSADQWRNVSDEANVGLPVPEPGAVHLPPPVQRAHQGHPAPRSASSSTARRWSRRSPSGATTSRA